MNENKGQGHHQYSKHSPYYEAELAAQRRRGEIPPPPGTGTASATATTATCGGTGTERTATSRLAAVSVSTAQRTPFTSGPPLDRDGDDATGGILTTAAANGNTFTRGATTTATAFDRGTAAGRFMQRLYKGKPVMFSTVDPLLAQKYKAGNERRQQRLVEEKAAQRAYIPRSKRRVNVPRLYGNGRGGDGGVGGVGVEAESESGVGAPAPLQQYRYQRFSRRTESSIKAAMKGDTHFHRPQVPARFVGSQPTTTEEEKDKLRFKFEFGHLYNNTSEVDGTAVGEGEVRDGGDGLLSHGKMKRSLRKNRNKTNRLLNEDEDDDEGDDDVEDPPTTLRDVKLRQFKQITKEITARKAFIKEMFAIHQEEQQKKKQKKTHGGGGRTIETGGSPNSHSALVVEEDLPTGGSRIYINLSKKEKEVIDRVEQEVADRVKELQDLDGWLKNHDG